MVHVLQTSQNLVIVCCPFAENGKEMYKNVQRTCRAIVPVAVAVVVCLNSLMFIDGCFFSVLNKYKNKLDCLVPEVLYTICDAGVFPLRNGKWKLNLTTANEHIASGNLTLSNSLGLGKGRKPSLISGFLGFRTDQGLLPRTELRCSLFFFST